MKYMPLYIHAAISKSTKQNKTQKPPQKPKPTLLVPSISDRAVTSEPTRGSYIHTVWLNHLAPEQGEAEAIAIVNKNLKKPQFNEISIICVKNDSSRL